MKTLVRFFALLFFLVPAIAVGATPPSLRLAEEELAHHLALMGGAAVVTAKGAPVEVVLGKPAPGTGTVQPFASYGKLVGNNLYLWGDDGGKKPRYGTLFAVYGFLEAVGGVRWPAPGEANIRVPKTKHLTVPEGWSQTYVPPLLFSRLRNPKVENLIARSQAKDPKHPLSVAEAEKLRADNERWFLRMRHQTRVKFPHGHAFTDWQEKYLVDHPDWFALNKDGKRGNPKKRADRVKLCLANPEVVAEILRQWQANGTGEYLNICPNDSAGYCRCEACAKMGETLTDRYVTFWNKVAAEAVKVRKDVKVVTYLYADYRLPPKTARFAYPDNMYCGIVPHLDDDPKAYLAGWKQAGLKTFFFRPNYLGPKTFAPVQLERRVYDDFQLYYRNGMTGVDYDCWAGDPAVARELYIVARLIADPTLTFEQIVNELR